MRTGKKIQQKDIEGKDILLGDYFICDVYFANHMGNYKQIMKVVKNKENKYMGEIMNGLYKGTGVYPNWNKVKMER